MTFLLYIGKNKDFLRKFSKLENVQMIYAQSYQDAITICIRLKAPICSISPFISPCS